MKAKYLRIAEIFSYIFAGLYAIATACFYSVGENIYWLFLVFMFASVVLGLCSESIVCRLDQKNELNKNDFISMIIITVLSVISPLSCLFNILTLTSKSEAKVKYVINEEYKEKEVKEKKWFKKPCVIVAITAFLTIVLASVSGNLFETSGGKVAVFDGTLTQELCQEYNTGGLNGVEYKIEDPTVSYSYTVYKPAEASATNPLPAVFVVPGFTRTKATMTQYAVELSKRGAVVFTIDPGAQGSTTYAGYEIDPDTGEYIVDDNGNKTHNNYAIARSGLGYLLTFVYNNIDEFDYIDRDKIGAVGHSAGGGDTVKLAADFAGDSYETSIIKALYFSGYIKTSAANVFYKLRCNTAMSYPKYDEGEFRYQDENQAYEIIAQRFINEVNSKTNGANGKYDDFIEGYEYGNFEDGTFRVIYNENMNHCFEMYDAHSIANLTGFFRRSLGLNTELKDTEQTWFGKELSNGIALAAAFTLIISLISVIVTYVPFMKSLSVAAEERRTNELTFVRTYSRDSYVRNKEGTPRKNRGVGKRLLFWIPMILTAIIACLDYIPLARLSMSIFPEAAGNIPTWYFPERMMNAVFLWAVVNGSVGIVIWVLTTLFENLYYHIEWIVKGKPEGGSRVDWSKFAGLKVKPLDLLKSLGMTVVLFLVFYGVLQLMYTTTHQDFRFMLISASPLNARMVMTWLIYLAGFYVFYISNSIRVNLGIAREGYKEWQVMLISALANSLGLVFIIVINYVVYFETGTVFYGYYSPTDSNEMWLYVNMVFGLIPMMAILPIFNRLAYKKTGNVYSGALLFCMIFIMMSLSASISFIPM